MIRARSAVCIKATSCAGTMRVADRARTGYIGRETDNETDLGFGACPERKRGRVRLYEPEYGRFLSTDVLWEKYLPLQPYQYAGNEPVQHTDPSGKIVEAADKCAQELVRASIESAYRDKVAFDANGVLNTSMIVDAASGTDANSNVFRLAELAKASDIVNVQESASVMAVQSGKEGTLTFTKNLSGNPKEPKLGITLFPRESEVMFEGKPFLSTDNTVKVVARDDRPSNAGKGPGQVVAHELFLHVYYYLRAKKGESVSPLHRATSNDPPTEVDKDKKMVEANATK